MDKLLDFDTRNENGVFAYTIGKGRDKGYLEKTASAQFHPDIAKYISEAVSTPGKVQVLLIALGAGEYYGPNRNGDFFPAASLSYGGQEYGHKTFETGAHVFKHHINKDPLKAYGVVNLSVWNEKMKRVELIITVEEAKAPDLVDKINAGENLAVSMGCRVPYDVCSICGNKAKTREEYCDHLRYSLNRIPPGQTKRAYAINTIPKFFDISFVLVPADPIAQTMKKVASVSSAEQASSVIKKASAQPNFFDKNTFEKVAFGLSKEKVAAKKVAEIEKEIPSNLDNNVVGKLTSLGENGSEALRDLEPEIPKKTIIIMANMNPGIEGLNRALSTLSFAGVVPKPSEFQSLALRCLGKTHEADEYERLGLTFAPSLKVPQDTMCSCEKELQIEPRHFDRNTLSLIMPFLEDRSYARPLLQKRVIRLVKLAEQGQLTYPSDEHVKFANEDKSKKIGMLPMMILLAGLYKVLGNKAPMGAMSGTDKVLLENPGLALALGVGGVAGASALFARQVKGKYDFNPDKGPMQIGSWQDEIHRKNMNPITKTAEAPVGSIAKRLFLGVPALYMASGLQEVKKARNPMSEEGSLASFIRKHPDIASAALVGEGMAGFPVTKGIQNLTRSGLNLLRKTASVKDELVSTAIFSMAFPGVSPAVRAATSAIDYGIITQIDKLLKHKKRNP